MSDLALSARVAAPVETGGRTEVAFTVALTIFGALLSLVATGWVPFVDNNVFHLPILGRLYELPQYADDPFIQSLRHYSSGFWQALAGGDRFVTPWVTMVALWIASRILMVAGFLACASVLGVKGRAQQIVFVALLASCDLMIGFSFAGGGGLFFDQATHSEVANGLLLLSWSFAARGRFAPALALTGAAFFCNSFMAIWNLPALAAVAILLLRSGRIGLAALSRDAAVGGCVFAVFAIPVIAMIVGNPEFGAAPPVDYREFLAGYWPRHFLFDSTPDFERVGLALVVALGVLSLSALGVQAPPFAAIFGGFVAIYAVGVAAPYLTSAPLVLNLHLLRSSAALHMLAALAALAVATTWLFKGDLWRSRVVAPALIVTLCALPVATLLAVLALAADRLPHPARAKATVFLSRFDGRATLVVVAGLVAASFVLGSVAKDEKNRIYRGWSAEWTVLADWVRTNTDEDAVFLMPAVDLKRPPSDVDRARAASNSVVFEYAARRRVWTDFKRGAAVMWSPSYYAEWRTRTDDVLALASLDQRLAYAEAHGVGYVVDLCAQNRERRPIFGGARLCIYPSAPMTLRGASSASGK